MQTDAKGISCNRHERLQQVRSRAAKRRPERVMVRTSQVDAPAYGLIEVERRTLKTSEHDRELFCALRFEGPAAGACEHLLRRGDCLVHTHLRSLRVAIALLVFRRRLHCWGVTSCPGTRVLGSFSALESR